MSGPPYRTHLQKVGRGRPAAIVALVGLLSSMLVFFTPVPASALTAATAKFQTNVSGDITLAANHNMTCTSGCTTANSGVMAYVDVDGTGTSPLAAGGTVTTFNSSSADVVVPTGSTVLFAGLFWSGNLASGANQGGTGGSNAPTPANMNQVRFRTPALSGYTTITALPADVDTDGINNATFPVFHAYANVVGAVRAQRRQRHIHRG
jgi:large repetitive protein